MSDLRDIRKNLATSDQPAKQDLESIRNNINSSLKTEVSTYGLKNITEGASIDITTKNDD